MPQAKAKAKSKVLPAPPVDLKKSELTRIRVVDAAARVFAQRGYGHTRLSDVAKVAGMHAGGIYYYFASREELVQEVLRTCTIRATDDLNNALASMPESATTEQLIMAAATAQIGGVIGTDNYNKAFNKIFSQIPDEIRVRHQPLLREYFSVWRGLIRRGQESGEIRRDIDPAILRLTITGALQWSSEWANSSHGTPENLARNIMAIFFSGMLVHPAPSAKIVEKPRKKRSVGVQSGGISSGRRDQQHIAGNLDAE